MESISDKCLSLQRKNIKTDVNIGDPIWKEVGIHCFLIFGGFYAKKRTWSHHDNHTFACLPH